MVLIYEIHLWLLYQITYQCLLLLTIHHFDVHWLFLPALPSSPFLITLRPRLRSRVLLLIRIRPWSWPFQKLHLCNILIQKFCFKQLCLRKVIFNLATVSFGLHVGIEWWFANCLVEWCSAPLFWAGHIDRIVLIYAHMAVSMRLICGRACAFPFLAHFGRSRRIT